jgi:hypothetical protein
MEIRTIFQKNITRPINGVVKADQLNEAVVWQELDEYVVTRELDRHLRVFLSAYLAADDNPTDPTIASRMAVWVSGFFGSGKSHFIKILSYLLVNRAATHPETDQSKNAVDFFPDKVADPMCMGDLRRIAAADTDVILFNIDSRADAGDGRATILSVFWRVFNEHLGFCGESLHLAEIERYLARKGKLDAFKARFEEIYGAPWEDERDAFTLLQDEIVQALSDVLDKSPQAAADWFEKSTTEFNLTVESFAKRVNEYLETCAPKKRIIFLVDEVGQFIGGDTRLMLNLQTIVEDLGRLCNGRAWVVVTSQEDIDAVLGDLKAAKAHDFSKIQGRFTTRLSLSSSNTDEVIQARLLQKTDAAVAELEMLFAEKGDILKNQLSFSHDSTTLRNFTEASDFVTNYPFAPYHFQLVQKIFESIRKAGATGLHLSKGERSMLDAFQSAAMDVSKQQVGALVALQAFFPCIESFLDTSVKRSIEQAWDNTGLEKPFDVKLLQTLFLIRYVDIVKPRVDNLVTLCIDEVDADRIDLKKKIEAALQRLEKENLINRNGDLYFFLTNEEREVTREIKGVEISGAAETQLLGDIVFDSLLKGKTKYRYQPYKRDYPFNRICDGRFWGKELKDEIGLEIISPLHDEYGLFNNGKCNLYSANQDGFILVKLGDDKALASEIRRYLQTKKYIENKNDAAAPTTLKQILRDHADENRLRKERLEELVARLTVEADYFALGKGLEINETSAAKAIDRAFEHLVQNVFGKYSYLSSVAEDPVKEIKAVLASDDIAQQQMLFDFENSEPRDIKEISTYIDLKTASNQTVMLSDLTANFSRRPYGWPEYQVVVLAAKYFMAGKISLLIEKDKLKPEDAFGPLSKTSQWRQVKVVKRKSLDGPELEKARKLAQDLFGTMPPAGSDPLVAFIRENLAQWGSELDKFQTLADTGNYPGRAEIESALAQIGKLMPIHDGAEFARGFNAAKNDLMDASDDLADLRDFYKNQRTTWESLQAAASRFKSNRSILDKDEKAARALKRMDEILNAPHPYGMLKEVGSLVAAVEKINETLVAKAQEEATKEVDDKIERLKKVLAENKADDTLHNKTLKPLQDIKRKILDEYSIPQISYSVSDAQDCYEEALAEIETSVAPSPDPQPPKKIKAIKPAEYKHKTYLETEADVNAYVDKVRTVLLEAIHDNLRISLK